MKLLLTLLAFGCLNFAFAQQNITVHYSVKSSDGEPIAFGTLQLVHQDTQANYYFSVTDGEVTTDAIATGSYTVAITAIGFATYTQEILLTENRYLQIVLQPDVTQLGDVTVTSTQQSITYKNGVFKVDVARSNLANIPETADVLAKLPGVILSPDRESVNILGKGIPLLYLGHQRISMEQLKSIPVNSIDTIELIRNPSAKYEANGNAVIVITLKKKTDRGYQVQISENASMNHNFNNYLNSNAYIGLSKVNLQLGLGYNQLDHWESNTTLLTYAERNFKNGYTVLSEGPRMQIPGSLGGEYNFNDTDYISTRTDFTIHRDTMPLETQTTIEDNGTVSDYRYHTESKGVRDYISSNMNYYKKLTEKAGLFTGMQYTHMVRDNRNTVYNVTIPETTELQQINHQKTNAEVFTAKTDAEIQLTEKTKFEGGLNIYLAKTDAESGTSETERPDYRYAEGTYAAYAQAQGTWGAVSYTSGLRLEHNQVKGTYPETNEVVVERNKTYLFPRISSTVELDSLNAITVNYARSIDRPSFAQANNTAIFINKYMQIANSINLQSSLKGEVSLEYRHNRASLTFTYYQNTNAVYYLTRYNTEADVLEMSPVNVKREDNYQLILMLPFIYKVWNSTNYFYGGLVDGKDEVVQNLGVTPFFYFYTDNEFRLPKDVSFGMNFYYMSPHKEGIRSSEGFSALGLYANKKFNEHWKVGMLANDVFRTLEFVQGYTSYGITNNATYFSDNRCLSLLVTYTFGQLAKPDLKNKEVDDNLNRVN